MDLRNFFQLLRDHWKLITFVTLLSAAVSSMLTARMTPMYASSVTLYVSAQAKTSDPITAYQGSLLSQQEVQSYADLLGGPMLARTVVTDLGLNMTAAHLAAEISTRPIPQTVLLTATVTDSSAGRAQRIAASVGRQFVKLVSVLERPPGGGKPTVKVTVVAPAELPSRPVSPNRSRNVGVASALGLLLGIGLTAAKRSLDTTIKSVDQLSTTTAEKPVMGTIPFTPAARKHPLVTDGKAFGRRVEAFRKICTNLQFIDIDVPHRVLMFTSALPEEGKSSTVCNLAITLAQAGKRVIVVEADLRRPRAAGYLGLPNGVGLTDILLGRTAIEDTVQIWGDEEFTVLASGPPPPNPSDLLGSQRMRQLVERLRREYDIVLVDAPPVLPFADAVAAAPACDGVIFIVRYGKTRIDHVRRAAEALAAVGSPILGSVLSMAPGGRHPEYGYGYYGYRRYRLREHDSAQTRETPDGEQLTAQSLTAEMAEGVHVVGQGADSEGCDGGQFASQGHDGGVTDGGHFARHSHDGDVAVGEVADGEGAEGEVPDGELPTEPSHAALS